MPSLHVSPVDEPAGWLVVPEAVDPVLEWAMAQPGVRLAPGFGGWFVPASSEDVLWRAVVHVTGEAALCRACLRGGAAACEAWGRIVAERFRDLLDPAWRAREQASRYRAAEALARALSEEETREQEAVFEDRSVGSRRVRPAPQPRRPADSPQRRAARVLGIDWPASRSDVVAAFRRAALRSHPDVGGSNAAMVEVVRARAVLLGA